MKNNVKKTETCANDSCAHTDAKSLWLAGGVITVLAVIFSVAIFQIKDKPVPVQDPVQGVAVTGGGGMQAAFPSANCIPCPSLNQCFPQGTGGAQQAAFGQGYCAIRCPFCNFAYNDVYAGTKGASQCPRCFGMIPFGNRAGGGFAAAALPPNCTTCPNFTQCFPQGNTGAQQAAFSNPNCATYPNAAQCFPNGQTVALTQPLTATNAPPIFRDAVMSHEFRGVCENCHIVRPDITIQATAQMPHEYRGVCSNCHAILGLQTVK